MTSDVMTGFVTTGYYKCANHMRHDTGQRQTRAVTDKAIRLYGWMLRFYAEQKCSPSVREVQEAIGVASSSTAGRYLAVLIRWGWIKRTKRNGVRNIVFTRASEVGLSAEQIAAMAKRHKWWDV